MQVDKKPTADFKTVIMRAASATIVGSSLFFITGLSALPEIEFRQLFLLYVDAMEFAVSVIFGSTLLLTYYTVISASPGSRWIVLIAFASLFAAFWLVGALELVTSKERQFFNRLRAYAVEHLE